MGWLSRFFGIEDTVATVTRGYVDSGVPVIGAEAKARKDIRNAIASGKDVVDIHTGHTTVRVSIRRNNEIQKR